jgi:hypothetical protein
MDASSQEDREIRAARNQALFRAVNEKLRSVETASKYTNETFVVACECADLGCVSTLEIAPDRYFEVRANPRHFVVLSGHVYPEVEAVVSQLDGYVVVEKLAAAGETAEADAR